MGDAFAGKSAPFDPKNFQLVVQWLKRQMGSK
jgi:hypothetical protein